MSFVIEKIWNYKGRKCAVLIMDNGEGHRCGYVEVPDDSVFADREYNDKLPQNTAIKAYAENIQVDVEKCGILPILCQAMSSGDENDIRIDVLIQCHGGLTFSERNDMYPLVMSKKRFWYGFDCAHYGDYSKFSQGGTKRTLKYCIGECESIIDQMIDIENMYEKSRA